LSEVIREIHIEAQPETVYAYFTEAEKLMMWMGVEAKLEPHPEGCFRVVINSDRIVMGQYLELTPFSRIVVSWGWEGGEDVPPGSSTVEITLTPNAEGTLVHLRHYNLPETAMLLHTKSWEHNLPRLKTVVEQPET
jgi:uncharacterized protein YndB with AHSA1/START domain